MKYTAKNPNDPNDRSNWTLDDGKPLSEDQWTKFQQWRQGGAPKQIAPGGAAADGQSGDPAWYTQIGRGLARGVASDIPVLSSSQFATQEDAGPLETGARLVGEYGPMFIPGLDFGLGAKFGTKAAQWALEHGPALKTLEKVLGPAKAQAMIEGLWHGAPKAGSAVAEGAIGGVMADPEHPIRGATTGAVTGGVVRALPKGVKKFATGTAAAGAGYGAWEATRGARGGRGGDWPAYFAAQHVMSPLAMTAAAAALHRPALAGAAGATGRRWWEDDGQENQ